MANSFTFLADLEAGRCSNTAEVYLLRRFERGFWQLEYVQQFPHGETTGTARRREESRRNYYNYRRSHRLFVGNNAS
ncbi:unnamed protein product [Brassica oleracea var. botrytis]|uniref:(rape) hypothetical protein n=1 Tax=Brassica napus TaxID=3708 RepID=A0A816INL4_BRANA|nr:unnamed protein product [Brassica napus]